MGLLELHQGERRKRILAAARRMIAKHGFEGLTMRELAVAAKVSVPTLYNLFGSKHALLQGEMEETFATIAARIASSTDGDLSERVLAVYAAGMDEMFGRAAYYRELVRVFLTEPALDDVRKKVDEAYIGAMGMRLREGQARGELAAWVDAEVLSAQLFFHYMMTVLGWAKGELDDDGARAIAIHGACLLMLGVTTGEVARRFEARAKDAQRILTKR